MWCVSKAVLPRKVPWTAIFIVIVLRMAGEGLWGSERARHQLQTTQLGNGGWGSNENPGCDD